VNLYQAQKQVYELKNTFFAMHERDPNQEVGTFALKPLDVLLEGVKPHLKDDALTASIRDVISPEMIEEGGTVPVADLLVLATMLQARIGVPNTSYGFS
jgi:hypothetical protein